MTNINRSFALVLGIVFVLIGILGFVPVFVPGGALLGIFGVNALHNVVHLLFGVVGIAAALTGWPRIYNQVAGIVYFLIGILGFIPALVPHGLLLGLVDVNVADNILHLVIGAAAVYVGFAIQNSRRAATAHN
jgi:hypothetical protein